MGRLNNIIKFTVFNFSTILGLLGLLVLVASIYVMSEDWGDLSTTFFLGLGLVMGCFGIVFL